METTRQSPGTMSTAIIAYFSRFVNSWEVVCVALDEKTTACHIPVHGNFLWHLPNMVDDHGE